MQIEVVGIKFSLNSREYSFYPNGLKLKKGDNVFVESDRGEVHGIVTKENYNIDSESLKTPLKGVIRIIPDSVIEQTKENNKKIQKLLPDVKAIVAESGLNMKVVGIEASVEPNKIIINFCAETRVDFRDLVKNLAEKLHMRIELRQIGSRDAVSMMGGYGPCGKECCCVRTFGEFDHVTMRMAKTQELSLNPNSISGLCGKLMCCLAYENSHYAESARIMPNVNSEVKTPDGVGVVAYNNLLNRTVDVKFTKGDDNEIKTYQLSDLKFRKEKENENRNGTT